MKRYRPLNQDMDFRATHLSREINESWEPEIQEMHRRSHEDLRQGLVHEFGEFNANAKIQNFIDMENAPYSIIAYHNKFFRQVRYAFVIGSYYPALTGACALGERVLNHLLLRLRGFYKSTPQYKNVYRKSSFDNWQLAIDTLEAWGVLLPEAVTHYKLLAGIRNRAIHFNPDTDHNDRELALEAIKTLSRIINEQFTVFGVRPWFIPGTPGVCFIKKEAENNPFIREVYLPNCALVGPYHTLELQPTSEGTIVVVHDDCDYEQKEITDEEFKELHLNQR
jgi:hypothetical protein